MKLTKSLLSVLLCVAMLVTYMPVAAFAEDSEIAPSTLAEETQNEVSEAEVEAPADAEPAEEESAEVPAADSQENAAENNAAEEPAADEEAANEEAVAKNSEDAAEASAGDAEKAEAVDAPAADAEDKDSKDEKAHMVTYEATCDGIRVTAKAKSDVLPKGAMLKVKRVSNAYGASLLNNSNIEYDGFVAMDISFVAGGREVEPEGNVKVTAQVASSLIGDAADMGTLQMVHFENNSRAEVVDSSVSVSGSKATAGFTVDNFSIFTIVYEHLLSSDGKLEINCIDENGNHIGNNYRTNIDTGNYTFAKLAPKFRGYTLKKVVFKDFSDPNATDYKDYYIRHVLFDSIWGTGWRCSEDTIYIRGDYDVEEPVYFIYASDKTSVTATIMKDGWDDGEDADGIRPSSVTVRLLKNRKDTGKTVTLNASNTWTATFYDLDIYYDEGKGNVYTVEEVKDTVITGTDGIGTYGVSYEYETGDGILCKITNTHTPEKITVSGTKTWDDANDAEGLRPRSITVNLEATVRGDKVDVTAFGQQASQTVTPDAKGNWTYSWTNLPKRDGGAEIKYTVTENAVQYYDTTYNGFDITNKLQDSMKSIYVAKYKFKSATSGKTLPAEIINSTPVDPRTYRDQTVITADSKSFPHTYKVEGGKWVFKGYRKGANGAYGDAEITSQTINKGDIYFVGYWEFQADEAKKGVDTGDTNNILPSALLMILAAGGIAVIRRKRED